MIKIIANRWKLILVITILFLGIGFYANSLRIENLPTGKYIESFVSPKQQFILKVYLIEGDSLSGNAIRVELCDNNQYIRNIYYNYPKNSVNIRWINDEEILIDEMKLNIYNDTFNWKINH